MKLLPHIVAHTRLGRTCVWRDVLEVKDCHSGDVTGGLRLIIAPISRRRRPCKSSCSPISSLFTGCLTLQQLKSLNWRLPTKPSMKLLPHHRPLRSTSAMGSFLLGARCLLKVFLLFQLHRSGVDGFAAAQ